MWLWDRETSGYKTQQVVLVFVHTYNCNIEKETVNLRGIGEDMKDVRGRGHRRDWREEKNDVIVFSLE